MDSTIFPPGRVTIVAVLNATPDSFSDGGRFVQGSLQVNVAAAVDAAAELVSAGAHVLDVGGESTRPGSQPVAVDDEVGRTAPLIEALAKRFDTPVSIDTRKAPVAEAALDAGASIVNDVAGLGHDPAIAPLVASRGAGLIVGHLRGTPATMQDEVHFDDPVREVGDELAEAVAVARAAGVADAQLAVDPGIGFGKRLPHNLALIANVGALRERLGLPVLLGPSRKGFLGELTGEPVERRDPATAAACAVGVFAGADAVRVHDVAATAQAVTIGRALHEARRAEQPS